MIINLLQFAYQFLSAANKASFIKKGAQTFNAGAKLGSIAQQQKKIKALFDTKGITRIIGTPEKFVKDLLTKPDTIAEKLGKLTKEQRKVFGETVSESTGTEQAALSSSWAQYGVYQPFGALATSGTLKLTIKNKNTSKEYSYPNVSRTTWEAMKGAKGRNGTGAGTVFWALYLRGARASAGFQIFQEQAQLAGQVGIAQPRQTTGRII